MRVQVSRTGIHVPPEVETAEALSERVGRSAHWITTRTGVIERRVSRIGMDEMAADAARQVLGGEPPDLIVNASLTPIQLIPDSSVFIQRALGYDGIPSFSIHATCLSFLVALHQVGAIVSAGAYKRVLIVSAEQGSVCRDHSHPESAVLIGDGAAAALVEPTPAGAASEILAWDMRTFPSGAHLAELRGCGTAHHPNDPTTTEADNLFRMNGPGIYKKAVLAVGRMVRRVCDSAGIAPGDVDLVVPHQASGPALDTLSRFGLPQDRVIRVVDRYGNCIAASLPMALHTAVEEGRLERGMTVLLMGTGAGLSVGSAILRW
ncbi:MAG: 3-oxoacyl-[acyl-carrier-protein] synthase-3 [Myxococcota bacterium]|jgi:3-oxoacyl-[acyl-carrier-protein] synthase-3